MRSGAQYVSALDDGRTVYVDGTKVARVAEHPAFAGVVATMASVYDAACTPGSALVDPATGRLAIYSCPRTRAQHDLRKAALEQWCGLTHGFIGRGPDHVAGLLTGFASRPSLFDTATHQLGASVTECYDTAAARGLWITNSIVPPQQNVTDPTSRVRPVRLVAETADGIIVTGAQMLGTGAAVSDSIFVTSVRPLGSDEKERAVSFVVPVASPGLTLVCRRPYATLGDPFDYPLSTRFDETDAMVVFDQVLVRWSNVFAAGDVSVVNAQFFGTAAHQIANLQSIIRLTAKLRFVTGVASLVVKANGRHTDPAIKAQLAELATVQTVSEALTEAAHSHAEPDDAGVYRPAGKYLYAALGMQTDVYPKAIRLLGELAGGGVIALPSSIRDFDDADERAAMDVVMGSDQLPVQDRVQLFKLAWELIGSEFAGRHVQYERFYSGAVAAVRAQAHRFYPFDEVETLVGDFLTASRV